MAAQQTYRLFEVALKQRIVLSPSLTRMVFGGRDIAQMKSEGPDQRIKVFFPLPGQDVPQVPQGEDWYPRYRALPAGEQPPMRTYTIRALRAGQAEVDVDFVLHGEAGPASRWAMHAAIGDRVLLLAPDAGIKACSEGYEWRPPLDTRRVLLVADETALPAVAGILESLAQWPRPPAVQAFIEVEHPGDVLPLIAPLGAQLFWQVREGAAHGHYLQQALHAQFPAVATSQAPLPEIDIDRDILWEQGQADSAPLYTWVAGEAGMVMAVRRHLLRDCAIDKQAATFMGYWRHGRVLN